MQKMKTDIGSNIMKYRKLANMTQEELAEKLHMTRQAISNYERGKNQPDINVLTAMADIFNISIESLIYGEKAEKSYRMRILILSSIALLWVIAEAIACKQKDLSIESAEYPFFAMFEAYLLRPAFIMIIEYILLTFIDLPDRIRPRIKTGQRRFWLAVIGSVLLGYTFLIMDHMLVMKELLSENFGTGICVTILLFVKRYAGLSALIPIIFGFMLWLLCRQRVNPQFPFQSAA
jgi:transcriptional regulator with XRE-family HTH domain